MASSRESGSPQSASRHPHLPAVSPALKESREKQLQHMQANNVAGQPVPQPVGSPSAHRSSPLVTSSGTLLTPKGQQTQSPPQPHIPTPPLKDIRPGSSRHHPGRPDAMSGRLRSVSVPAPPGKLLAKRDTPDTIVLTPPDDSDVPETTELLPVQLPPRTIPPVDPQQRRSPHSSPDSSPPQSRQGKQLSPEMLPCTATPNMPPNASQFVLETQPMPPLPKRPMASPADLLSQSLSVLQEIKGLVYPAPSAFMPEETNVVIIGECLGLAEMLSKSGMKVTQIINDPDAVSKVRNARPAFHVAFVDCAPSKLLPAAFVTSISSVSPLPIILTMALGKPWHQQVQACIQAGAQGLITLPTTPEVLRITISDALKSDYIAKNLQQNISTHAQLLSHLSKILMEQDLYLRSLSEHLSLLERYKKHSERLISTLQHEVEELQKVNKTQEVRGDKLKMENVAIRWRRACDIVLKAKNANQGANKVLQDATDVLKQSLEKTGSTKEKMAVAAVAAATSSRAATPESAKLPRSTSEPPPGSPGSTASDESSVSVPEKTARSPSVPEDEAPGPLEMITHIVRKLSRIDHYLDKEDLKNVLLSVVKALAAKEWYVPRYKNLDGKTQQWMDSTFRNICPDAVDETTGQATPRLLARTQSLTEIEQSAPANPEAMLKEVSSSVNAEDLYNWSFSAVSYTPDQLLSFVVVIFKELDLIREWGIPIHTLVNFVGDVRSNYRPNPYHNFIHACDVAQVCFLFLKKTKLPDYLQKIDPLTLIVGALCHDLDHPGLNNVFQINARTELSLLYNDVSVLENHHAAFSFKLLSTDQDNVVVTLTPSQLQEFRRSIISEILATDMVKHFELVSRFQSHAEMGPFSKEKKEDRQLLLDIVLHAADISNLTRPQSVSLAWSDMLFDEYLRQGDEEKRLGLAVSPYMDRNDTDQVKMSINFIDFIGVPLFSAICKVFSELQCCVDMLKENRRWWDERRQQQQRQKQEQIGEQLKQEHESQKT